jgi:hypothetical protein
LRYFKFTALVLPRLAVSEITSCLLQVYEFPSLFRVNRRMSCRHGPEERFIPNLTVFMLGWRAGLCMAAGIPLSLAGSLSRGGGSGGRDGIEIGCDHNPQRSGQSLVVVCIDLHMPAIRQESGTRKSVDVPCWLYAFIYCDLRYLGSKLGAPVGKRLSTFVNASIPQIR